MATKLRESNFYCIIKILFVVSQEKKLSEVIKIIYFFLLFKVSLFINY